jgi:predicted molibdopterin-dependent oxidoreductase YjgC
VNALLVMGANPATERPDWHANLSKLDLLVVQDLFLTETAQLADVVLPAVSWAECDGTFTNLERRVQRAPKALGDPQSKAAPDWMILDHLAARMGAEWPFASVHAVTEEIMQAIPFYAGLSWDALGDQGLQWDAAAVRPAPALAPAVQMELPAGSAQRFALVTGTVLYDGGTLFRLTTQMQNMAFGARVGIHPDDAARLNLATGDDVQVSNDAGGLRLAARIDAQVQPGTVWIPESLAGAPVASLLGGQDVTWVDVAPVLEPVAA